MLTNIEILDNYGIFPMMKFCYLYFFAISLYYTVDLLTERTKTVIVHVTLLLNTVYVKLIL
jgi:hypothetical protein